MLNIYDPPLPFPSLCNIDLVTTVTYFDYLV